MEEVLVGMVDNAMLDQQQLRALADQVGKAKKARGGKKNDRNSGRGGTALPVLGGVVWFGLYLFRVRNPHVHMTAWVIVLLASLAMPFVMHWPTLTITRPPALAPVVLEESLAERHHVAGRGPAGIADGARRSVSQRALPRSIGG